MKVEAELHKLDIGSKYLVTATDKPPRSCIQLVFTLADGSLPLLVNIDKGVAMAVRDEITRALKMK